MIALFQVDGGTLVVVCGEYLFIIFLLILGLGAVAAYLADKNAKKWERR